MSSRAPSDPAVNASELFSLHGRRALITGSGQGIGLTLARGLALAGAEIVLNDIDAARLDAAVATLRVEGFSVTGRRFDVTNAAEIAAALGDCQRGEFAIDILINNAGIHRRAPLESMPLSRTESGQRSMTCSRNGTCRRRASWRAAAPTGAGEL